MLLVTRTFNFKCPSPTCRAHNTVTLNDRDEGQRVQVECTSCLGTFSIQVPTGMFKSSVYPFSLDLRTYIVGLRPR